MLQFPFISRKLQLSRPCQRPLWVKGLASPFQFALLRRGWAFPWARWVVGLPQGHWVALSSLPAVRTAALQMNALSRVTHKALSSSRDIHSPGAGARSPRLGRALGGCVVVGFAAVRSRMFFTTPLTSGTSDCLYHRPGRVLSDSSGWAPLKPSQPHR